MKYARIYGPRDLRVEDVPIPSIGPDDVLIRVRVSGICGSDIHRYLGDRFGLRMAPYPLNSGHEYCGDVTDVGKSVKRFRVGDRVTLGVSWARDGNGAFAEYIRMPRADESARPLAVMKVPETVSYEEAAQIEPLTVGVNAINGAKPKAGDKVLIFGAGPIGLSVLLCCQGEGIKDAVVSEVSPVRLKVAKELGATVIDPTKESLEDRVKVLTKGEGVDVAFECAGATVTTQQALAFTRREGKIVMVAHYSKSTPIDPEEIVSRNLIVYGLMGSTSYCKDPGKEALRLILEGKAKLKPLVSHEFPIEKSKEAFETAANPNISVKVLIRP